VSELHPIFMRGVPEGAPLLPYRATTQRCPACGETSLSNPRYCVGVDAVHSDKEVAWMLQGNMLVPGCRQTAAHLHLKCSSCGYQAVMETKDHAKRSVEGLIDSL
jgi:DNA-directed RNA polymerase subunit RPC12/RpoP